VVSLHCTYYYLLRDRFSLISDLSRSINSTLGKIRFTLILSIIILIYGRNWKGWNWSGQLSGYGGWWRWRLGWKFEIIVGVMISWKLSGLWTRQFRVHGDIKFWNAQNQTVLPIYCNILFIVSANFWKFTLIVNLYLIIFNFSV